MSKTKVYLVYCIAPEKLRAVDSNRLLNEWIKDTRLGTVIYHEHFANKPLGGVVFLEISSEEQFDYLMKEPCQSTSYLYEWQVSYHSLVHTTSTERFLFQTQYTLSAYRNVKLNYEFIEGDM